MSSGLTLQARDSITFLLLYIILLIIIFQRLNNILNRDLVFIYHYSSGASEETRAVHQGDKSLGRKQASITVNLRRLELM